jgi:D-tagatose-1,6-bisphosphate aldolase subunit GatZ/KbaZ
MSHPVDAFLHAQKNGEARGIASICSAHPWVLKTALHAFHPVLIESTCNQVNQFGGYTGMTPADFVAFVHRLAGENGFPVERLILGGDHLGPSPWQAEPAEAAMAKAAEMVQAYARAGFTKLHLDASMHLGDDDPSRPLDLELSACRTALLARAAEAASQALQPLRYVIGTEVPIPGGAMQHEERVHVTSVEDARHTFEATQSAFKAAGLEQAWERVIAMVVQPGVEFGDDFVLDYDPSAARGLARFSETIPQVYEAHSTDYQSRANLQNLVRDHFAILKVGPALTFAFREAVFALGMIEAELLPEGERSQIVETLEAAMLGDPRHWQGHYHGSENQQALARKYSLSDRMRYYWPDPQVQAALEKLLKNLSAIPLPHTLLSQFLPEMVETLRSGQIKNGLASIIAGRIERVLMDYSKACDLVDPAS